MHKLKFVNLVNLTIKNIFRRKVRSILTILSVIIGIAAVIALVLLSEGLFNAVQNQFDLLGSNTIFIFPTIFSSGPPQQINSRISSSDQLTYKDVDLIKKIKDVKEVYSFTYNVCEFEFKNEKQYALTIIAPNEDLDGFFDIMQLDLSSGESLKGTTSRKIIIGSYFADGVFEHKIKTGNRIKLNGIDFKVVGVLEAVGNIEDDSQVYITKETAKNIIDLDIEVRQILAKTRNDANITQVKEEIEDVLEKEHSEGAFMVFTSAQILEMVQTILGVLSFILISIAVISLVVGSIGVMNSVFTSVLERIGEIGVLKSIGAKIFDIVFLFVLESVLLSIVGGFIGLGFGIGIAKFVEWYAVSQNFEMLQIVINLKIIIYAVVISIVVGFISGILPALSAAKLKPVDALRKNI
jgi:putative ABC transport system permease protein